VIPLTGAGGVKRLLLNECGRETDNRPFGRVFEAGAHGNVHLTGGLTLG
jgi:hypothetical protein